MNWFEIIKNQRAVTDTATYVGTKTGDVPEKDEGRCYQKLLAIRDNSWKSSTFSTVFLDLSLLRKRLSRMSSCGCLVP